jgi:hypothetical protein
LLLVYWAARLWQLTSLPIFVDEGTYIDRALKIRAGNWTFAMEDGNILLPRLLALWLPPAESSAEAMIFAARWLTVAIDMFALLSVFLVAKRCFSQRAAWLAAIFYLVAPFIYFYDRMALADGPLLAFTALALWLALRVAEGQSSLPVSLALGLVFGLEGLTKLSGVLGWVVPALAIVSAADVGVALRQWRRWLLAYAAAMLLYAPVLVIGAGQYQIGAKSILALAPEDVLNQIVKNLLLLAEWLSGYFPGFFGLFILVALVAALALGRKGTIWLVSTLLPLAFFVLVSRVWYPRYILPALAPLMVLAGWLAANVAEWVLSLRQRRAMRSAFVSLLGLAVIVPPLYFDRLIASDPPLAPWPVVERWQYVEDWPAGYGVDQAALFFQEAAASSPEGIYVMRHNRSSAVLEPLDLYLGTNSRIALQSMNLDGDNTPNRLTRLSHEKPTYVVLDPPREGYDFHERYPLALARARFEKPGNQTAILVYEWQP